MMTMLHIADIPAHIFGRSSLRVVDSPSPRAVVAEPMSLWYMVAIMTIAALYLAWLNHWSAKSRNHKLSFKFLGKQRGGYAAKSEHIHPSYRGYARMAAMIGYAVIWLFLIRCVTMHEVDIVQRGANLTLLLGVAVPIIYIFQLSLVWAIGVLTHSRDFCKEVTRLKSVMFTIFTIVATPLLLCFVTGGELWFVPLCYVVGFVLVAIIALYIYESFLLFLSKKVSTLHTFLYLCTVEIFPITLIWGFFNR